VAPSVIHGRGVFSNQPIKQGAVIEECPVIKMVLDEMSVRRQMVLNYYAFMLDERVGECGFALGYGSLYNHSSSSNARYYYDEEKQVMVFEAIRPIARHEEITISYTPGEDTTSIEHWLQKPEL
jgi:SET domain-containing protein